jgi:hypothetical protein
VYSINPQKKDIAEVNTVLEQIANGTFVLPAGKGKPQKE